MNLKTWKTIWPLIFAVMFISFDTTILHGQRDNEETVFEPPTVAPAKPKSSVRQANATSLPNAPAAKGYRSGRAGVTQIGATMPLKSQRTPIQGTNPKSAFAGNPPVSNANSTNGGQVSVATNSTAPPTAIPVNNSTITTTAHTDQTAVIDRDGNDMTLMPRRQPGPEPIPVMSSPIDRGMAPAVRGSLFNLNGTTATERLFQLQSLHSELERENDELRRQNAGLSSRIKENQEQLSAGVREIQLARKDLMVARADLDRLRNDLTGLREKVRIAEKEHSAVLQTIGPLLQQLIDSDEVSALPPNPTERE